MDKDRVEGSLHQAKGKVKEVAGKVTGDAKLETEGKTEKNAGKVQNAVRHQGCRARQLTPRNHIDVKPGPSRGLFVRLRA